MSKLVCKKCNKTKNVDEKLWRCDCGGLLDLKYEAKFPLKKIAERKRTMWRYREAIPIRDDKNIISFNEGFTPLVEINLEGKVVLIKQDQLFQTGSYKDRGASVLVSKVKELGIQNVVEDSSGNAGSAMAAYCASAGIDCEIFVPESTSKGKLVQIRSYGAKLNKVPGNRENTAKAVLKAANDNYYASHSWSPYFFHGTKTFAYEVCEQLGWKQPDVVVLPVGNGTLLLGVYIGFKNLLQAGVIDSIPKLIAIQAKKCAPLYSSFRNLAVETNNFNAGHTIAEGIAISNPVRGSEILEAVRSTKGNFLAVSEDEIKNSLVEMARFGFFIEPTSASTIAGLKQYLRSSDKKEVVVSAFTGHGLKATDKFLKLLEH